MNLANLANGATTLFIGERSERSEPPIWAGSLVNLANLVNASEHYLVLDMNDNVMINKTGNSLLLSLLVLKAFASKYIWTLTNLWETRICF